MCIQFDLIKQKLSKYYFESKIKDDYLILLFDNDEYANNAYSYIDEFYKDIDITIQAEKVNGNKYGLELILKHRRWKK